MVLKDMKRTKAWHLLEKISQEDQIIKIDSLFAYMKTHFFPLEKNENDASEVQKMLVTGLSETTLNNCSDTIFCVAIIRHGLKNLNLPMLESKNWKSITKPLVHCVLSGLSGG